MKLDKFLSELKLESFTEIVAGRAAGGSAGGGVKTGKSNSSSSKSNKTTIKTSGKHKTKKIHVCGCP